MNLERSLRDKVSSLCQAETEAALRRFRAGCSTRSEHPNANCELHFFLAETCQMIGQKAAIKKGKHSRCGTHSLCAIACHKRSFSAGTRRELGEARSGRPHGALTKDFTCEGADRCICTIFRPTRRRFRKATPFGRW